MTVELFTNIKAYIGNIRLRKYMKRQKRKRGFYNLSTARSVGVLFDASYERNYKIANRFIEELRSKDLQTRGLGYVKHQEMINYLPHFEGMELFALESVNWFYYPQDDRVKEFMKADFDIFIDLTAEPYLVLKFITGLSQAHLKVGKDEPPSQFYDLALAFSEDKPLEEFIDLIKHYFEVIKSPHELVMN